MARSQSKDDIRRAQEDSARILRNVQEDSARILRNAQDDIARILRNAQDDVIRILKNVQDVTDDEEYVSNEFAPQKKDKMHTIGEMSSRLAHDLQNPLTIIKNTVDLLKLKQQDPDKKTTENYDRIERAVGRMSQQIKDVLDYVRTSNLQFENISLVSLLNTVISDLQIPQDIEVMLPANDVVIYGDAKQLEIVFANIILNSVQAVNGKGKIMIQASDTEHVTVIDIIDNGRGIEKENLPRVFEPLFTTKKDGTGLGLASCKSIIENHGGTIECSSIVGKGTVFTIKLPKY
jgi:two-component system sensor histidine kinase HydH